MKSNPCQKCFVGQASRERCDNCHFNLTSSRFAPEQLIDPISEQIIEFPQLEAAPPRWNFSTPDVFNSVVGFYHMLTNWYHHDESDDHKETETLFGIFIDLINNVDEAEVSNMPGKSVKWRASIRSRFGSEIMAWNDSDRKIVAMDWQLILDGQQFDRLEEHYLELRLLSHGDSGEDESHQEDLNFDDEESRISDSHPDLVVPVTDYGEDDDDRPVVDESVVWASAAKIDVLVHHIHRAADNVFRILSEICALEIEAANIKAKTAGHRDEAERSFKNSQLVLKRMKDFSQRYDAEMSALLEQLRAKEKRGEVIIKAIESSQEIVIQGLEQESATEHTIVELNDLRDQLDVYLKQLQVELEGMMEDSGKIENLLSRVNAIKLNIATMADGAEAALRRVRKAANEAEATKAAAEGERSTYQLYAFGIGVPALLVILLLLVLIL